MSKRPQSPSNVELSRFHDNRRLLHAKLFQENNDSCDDLLFDENVFESNLIRLNTRPSLALNDEFN